MQDVKGYYEYKIVEFKDEHGCTQTYGCMVKRDGEQFGAIFEATSHEQVFAWLRLVIGAYPGTDFNDDQQPGAVA